MQNIAAYTKSERKPTYHNILKDVLHKLPTLGQLTTYTVKIQVKINWILLKARLKNIKAFEGVK